MRGLRILTLLVMLALVSGHPAVARDEPLTLSPASPWVIDYADDSCGLQREFGTGDQRVILKLEKFEPDSDSIQVTVAGPKTRWRNRRASGRPAIRFVPDAEPLDISLPVNITMGDDWRGIAFFASLMIAPARASGLEGEALRAFVESYDRSARESEVTALEIDNGLVDDLVLQTGSLGPPMAAMRTCLDELLTHWGIDAEAHHSLRQPASPIDFEVWSPAVWRAYPRTLWERGEQAIVRLRLSVDATGQPDGCHIQLSVGDEEFSRNACQILLGRARFSPAIDAQGNPIASYFLLMVNFRQMGPR